MAGRGNPPHARVPVTGAAGPGRGESHPAARGRGDAGGGRGHPQADGCTGSRGRWGDDGYNAYGAGIHRGSSSTGAGRVEFKGPPGPFVEGAAGPV